MLLRNDSNDILLFYVSCRGGRSPRFGLLIFSFVFYWPSQGLDRIEVNRRNVVWGNRTLEVQNTIDGRAAPFGDLMRSSRATVGATTRMSTGVSITRGSTSGAMMNTGAVAVARRFT